MADSAAPAEAAAGTNLESNDVLKLPKNCKENRYYYRHREEILERQRKRRIENPEYQAKVKAREDARKKRQEETEKNNEIRKAEMEEKRRLKNDLLRQEKAKRTAEREAKRKIVESLILKFSGESKFAEV